MRHQFLLLGLTLALPGIALSFEVNGFSGGMDADSALKRLGERREVVQEVRGGTSLSRTFIGSFRGDSNVEAITICRGRLQSYQYDISGGLRSFVRLVQAEQASAGPGVGEATSRETPSGEWTQIKFTWPGSGGLKQIAYSRVASEQVYVRYASIPELCQ